MLDQLKHTSFTTLQQLKEVLHKTNNVQYASALNVLFGSSIGMHVRHIIEFYQALFHGLANNLVNYDARQRDLRLEHDVQFAQETLQMCIQLTDAIENNESICLATSQSLTDEQFVIPTNTFRELTYLIEHTIHHMAIIKMAYNENFQSIDLPEHFGIAYSTIKHKKLVHSNLSAS